MFDFLRYLIYYIYIVIHFLEGKVKLLKLRTRFAPSPTGFVHLGGVYQTMVGERLAHQSGGVFFLRIEDTDAKREIPGAAENLINTLSRYGIKFDEGATVGSDGQITDNGIYGPYKQSLRGDIYHVYAKKLVSEGNAYPCFTTDEELKALDPDSYAAIDIANGQRVVRALEVCLMTGKPFSSFKTSSRKKRDFEVEKIGLTRPRDVLYDRINRRVVQMVDEGLVDEVSSLRQYRDLAALQTVGYKEIFDWFDGKNESLDRAVELIQRNTRHYAKRQLSYWGRDKEIKWLEL